MTLVAWPSKAAFDAWHAGVKATLGLPRVGVNAATGLPDPTAALTTDYTITTRTMLDGQVVAIVEDEFPGSPDPIPPWTVGEAVPIGALRVFAEQKDSIGDKAHDTWVCVQAHTTQADWTPPQVPALWNYARTPGDNEWMPWIAVEVDEVLTYAGVEYICIQSHTTQPGWEPPNVPALWAAV